MGISFPGYNASIGIDLDIWTIEEGEKLTLEQKDELLIKHAKIFAENILKKYEIPFDAIWFREGEIPVKAFFRKSISASYLSQDDEFNLLIGSIQVYSYEDYYDACSDSTLRVYSLSPRQGRKGLYYG